ncbi:site-specific integrase [Francisella philomiragia]|uniref:site-specific integrase n=1 Tax=Francisella philomiragia TaxID=28110 RepID=UPI002243E1FD|nr:site-specific integrase [Francisella philomiragia]
MPSAKLTKTFIANLKPSNKTIDYFDSEVKGLILRISQTGVISYRLKYYINGKQKIYTIAKHGAITLLQAKKEAQRLQGLIIQGIDIQKEKKQDSKESEKDITFQEFLNQFGYKWYKNNNRCWEQDIRNINTTFKAILDKKMSEVNNKMFMISFLEEKRKENSWTDGTYNRNLGRIKGIFSRAVEHEFLQVNNLEKIKNTKGKRNDKVRYLSDLETQRFFKALENQTEQLKNIILVAYYTGMRKNEILSLEWEDIDIDTNQIVLKAQNTKSYNARYIPISPKIKNIFISKNSKGLVFQNSNGKKVPSFQYGWEKFLKEAEVENFRFHDLRHNFCSMLVMKGVPIYTVAQLAGHADVKTTQIYAHLSPDVKKSAIDLL